jgi:hypothetical protein
VVFSITASQRLSGRPGGVSRTCRAISEFDVDPRREGDLESTAQ